MDGRRVKDTAYGEKNYSFNGKLITEVSPFLIGDADFIELKNFHYSPTGIKTIKGMSNYTAFSEEVTVVVAENYQGNIVYQDYPSTPDADWTRIKLRVAPSLYSSSIIERTIARKYASSTWFYSGELALNHGSIQSPAEYFLECIEQGTTGSTPPDFDSLPFDEPIDDGDAQWVKRHGSLMGFISPAPDLTVCYTNGYYNWLYGGSEHKAGRIFNVTDPSAENNIDITDPLSNVFTDSSNVAVLKKDSSGDIWLYIGSPLKVRGFNLSIIVPNTVSTCNLMVKRYKLDGTWENATIDEDTTSKFFQSGEVLFSFSDDANDRKDPSDSITYLFGFYLYWYQLGLKVVSGTLPDDITLSYLTLQTIIQNIPNIWDGTYGTPIGFYIETSTGVYSDRTGAVLRRENLFYFTGTAWVVDRNSAAYIGGYTNYYIKSITPLAGFRILFPYDADNNRYVNTTASSSIQVYYWDGDNWTAVSGLSDFTSVGGVTHARDNIIYWTPVSPALERRRSFVTDTHCYVYKVSVNSAFSNNCWVDQIQLIPATRPIKNFLCCIQWNNRLVLAGNYGGAEKNVVVVSAPNSPYIWEGGQTAIYYTGQNPSSYIYALAVLFIRHGIDIQESLVVFNETEMFLITEREVRVTAKTGTVFPHTVKVCDLGFRVMEGINRSVVVFGNKNAVYLFDNSSVITISDDIRSLLADAEAMYGFYDQKNSWYHCLLYKDSEWKEYVFDFIYKKWFEIDRASYKITGGIQNGDNIEGFVINGVALLNDGDTLCGTTLTATLKTGMKPLLPSYALSTVMRRCKVTATKDSSVSLTFTITTDEDSYEEKTITLSKYVSDPQPLNLKGIAYQFQYSLSGKSGIELINTSVLYMRERILM